MLVELLGFEGLRARRPLTDSPFHVWVGTGLALTDGQFGREFRYLKQTKRFTAWFYKYFINTTPQGDFKNNEIAI